MQRADFSALLVTPDDDRHLYVCGPSGFMAAVPASPGKGGVPGHHDMLLTAAERAANDRLTPCCSRAVSPRLVLEL